MWDENVLHVKLIKTTNITVESIVLENADILVNFAMTGMNSDAVYVKTSTGGDGKEQHKNNKKRLILM